MEGPRTIYLIGAVIVLAALLWVVLKYIPVPPGTPQNPAALITNFNECVAAGYPVMESFPEQCTANGMTFVNERQTATTTPRTGGEPPAAGSGDQKPLGGCAPAGCSNQLCVEDSQANDIITTCEFRPEYACYRAARCERQASGQCGWTQTPELSTCLQGARVLQPFENVRQ